MPQSSEDVPGAAVQPGGRYRRLPEPVRLEDTIASQDPGPPPDPRAGRNPDQEFMLRHA